MGSWQVSAPTVDCAECCMGYPVRFRRYGSDAGVWNDWQQVNDLAWSQNYAKGNLKLQSCGHGRYVTVLWAFFLGCRAARRFLTADFAQTALWSCCSGVLLCFGNVFAGALGVSYFFIHSLHISSLWVSWGFSAVGALPQAD